MKKKIISYGLSAIVLISVFAMAMPASAVVQMADEFGVNDASGDMGTYVEVPVSIMNVANGPIQTIKFDVLYTDSIISLETIKVDGLTTGWTGTLGGNKKSITLTTFDQTKAIADSSTGSVVLLNFSVIGSGTSPMEMSAIDFSNTNNDKGTAPAKDGTFTVKGAVVTAGGIIINEIMYNPVGTESWYEWIELYNNDTQSIDVSGWVLNGTIGGSDTILSGTMGKEEYLVIAKNLTAFQERYPDATCEKIKGNWSALGNTGDTINLWDSTFTLTDSVTYPSGLPDNYSIELNATGGWEQSLVEGGTPCQLNSVLMSAEDTTAPTTTITPTPAEPPSGWWNDSVTLSVHRVDNGGGNITGVAYTNYSMTGAAPWTSVLGNDYFTVIVTAEGETTFWYYSVDNAGNPEATKNVTVRIDKTPPASITNLHSTNGTTWINWTWTNPTDPLSGFDHTEVWIDGNRETTSNPFYNATGLSADTTYEMGTRSVDIAGNINASWVNGTAKTLPPVAYAVDLSVHVTEQIVAPSKNATYLLTVRNLGTEMDNYTLTLDNPDNAATATLEENVAKLDDTHYKTGDVSGAGDSIVVLLNVASETAGTFRVNVTANSTGDPSKIAEVRTTTKVSPINMTGFEVQDGKLGSDLEANVTMKNEGASEEWFIVTVTGLHETTGYPLVGTGVLRLDVGEEITIPLLVYIPASADEGNYKLFANVWKYDDYPDLTKTVYVGPEVAEVTSP